ncbi:MAG: HD-GYP domain-containing protein [Gammaproteobacteria bacterium]|nr:HD-GYP domain-containing protein [Gammaproteobacteria bacterium]
MPESNINITDDRPGGDAFDSLLASLLTMAWFVEARDPYTGGHLWRVSRYARLLAEAAGVPEAEAARIGLGGFLHDLGKVGVPDAILRKPGALSGEEYAIIQTHPAVGMRMLAAHPLAKLVGDAVLLHHERPDGTGYPHGLPGEDVPAIARMVGICDAFDAMTSHRPYRAGMPRDKALAIIAKLRGVQFDAQYADAFLALGEAGELDQFIRHSDDGIPLQTCPMCGPTLVVQRDQQVGDHLYCRNCGGEFVLEPENAHLTARPTGGKGNPQALAPQVDTALIAETVHSAAAALSANGLGAEFTGQQHKENR